MDPGGRPAKARRASTPPDQDRLEALEALFPEAFSEGRVDFRRLRQALGDAVDDGPERYAFTWAGKGEAIRLLRAPAEAALAPAPEESVGFPETRNLFIEGDNLEALKLLYKPMAGRVKMIYIDPPYNTGGEFVYPDDYSDPLAAYLRLTGQSDRQGNLLTSNPETSGRHHSAWLSMMYPRLFLARQLLRDDGIIFVSIDEHERHNLQLLMNEIFGEENLVADLIWKKKSGGGSDAKEIVVDHEHILAYGRSRPAALFPDRGATPATHYNRTDEEGRRYSLDRLDKPSLGYQESLDFPIEGPDGRTYRVPHADLLRKVARWRWSRKTVEERRGELVFRWPYVYTRNYEKEGSRPRSLLVDRRFGRTRTGKTDLTALFGAEVLERAKPVRLIRHLCAIAAGPDDIVLDFFAGSGTTGQAVMEQNRDDGGRRRWILVQLPEPTGEKSAARAEGLRTIAAIGAERLRRSIARLREEEGAPPGGNGPEDLGFRLFRLTESNFRPWSEPAEPDPREYERSLQDFADPLRDGWKPLDVLFEVALKEGFGLDCRVHRLDGTGGNTVYRVTDEGRDQSFHLCLDAELGAETLRCLGLGREDLLICRDAALTDEAAANAAMTCRLKTL